MFHWNEDGTASDEARAQEEGGDAFSPEDGFEQFSPSPRARRHSQSSRRSSRSSRSSRNSRKSRASRTSSSSKEQDSRDGDEARLKFAQRGGSVFSTGSAFSASSVFDRFDTPTEEASLRRVCVPFTFWLISLLATVGVSLLTYFGKGFVLTEGSFGYDTQVSDPATAQLQRWQRAQRLAEPNVGLGLPTGGVDSTTEYVTWRRVALIYQLPEGNTVSSLGMERAKAVEEALLSLPGWQRLCGEMPSSYQRLCRVGDSMVSASYGTLQQVSSPLAAQGVSADIALDGNGSQVRISAETLTKTLEELSPRTLDRWLPKDAAGSRSTSALRSSFSFALRLESAAATWRNLILEEVEPMLVELGVMSPNRDQQSQFRVYLEADGLPQVQANELLRSMDEDLPLLVFGPVGAFVATLLRGRLLVAITAAALAFAVPVITSAGILEAQGDGVLGGAEVRIVAAAAWFLVAAGVADISVACAHALEERREPLRLLAPQWLMVRTLSQQKPSEVGLQLLSRVLLYVASEELRGAGAVLLKLGRFVVEALLPTAGVGLMLLLLSTPDLEMVEDFGRHAGLGLVVCVPLAALMVPPAVDAGDAMAGLIQTWREAGDLDLLEAVQAIFDNFFPFELGAKQDWAMELKSKMRKCMRDFLRVRWITFLVVLVLAGLSVTFLVVAVLLQDDAVFTARTPPLFEAGHRLYDKASVLQDFDFLGDYEAPLQEGLESARQCFPWASSAADCAWYHCEAGQLASQPAFAEDEASECKCYQKQVAAGCSGSAARLFGLDVPKARTLILDGIFWSWVGARLSRRIDGDATAVPESFVEIEVWSTGGRSLDDGVSSEVGAASWDSACLQVLCYCGLECRDQWGATLGTLATTGLNASHNSLEAPAATSTSNTSESGTVSLTVAWGIQVSTEPLSLELDQGIRFSSNLILEDLQTQRQLLAFCEGTAPELVIIKRNCWPVTFKRWLLERGSYYPVTSELFYPSLRRFFEEQPAESGAQDDQDLGGFWLSTEGRATALYFTFEVAVETDGSKQPLQLEKWHSYLSLRAGVSPSSLGQAWLAPTSAVLEQGQKATAAIVRRNARSVSTFCILFPALLLLLLTWSWGLAITAALLSALSSFVVGFHHVRVNQMEVGVLEVVSLVSYNAMITLGLLRASVHVAWCQDGVGRDPHLRQRKQRQAQKTGLLSVLLGLCAEESEGKPTFQLRSLSKEYGALSGVEAVRSVDDLPAAEQKALLRRMDHLNSLAIFPGGLRHERLGRTSRGSCRAGQEVFTTLVSLVVGSAPVLFTSLTGVGQVCVAGMLGGVVCMLLVYTFFPVLMMQGLGPSRVKQRALALFLWWFWAGRPRPAPDSTPPGLLDTDLGTVGVASAQMLGPPFSWMAQTAKSSHRSHGEGVKAAEKVEVTIHNLDLQGATAAPPFHTASVLQDKFSGSG